MDDFKGELREFFSIERVGFGVADITGHHPLSGEFPRALSICLPYKYWQRFNVYNEERFHELLEETRAIMGETINRLSGLLKLNSGVIKHMIVPQVGQDPETPLWLFSPTSSRRCAQVWDGSAKAPF